MLQRGAARVAAVDVGYGQLHERLRADPRVTVLERTNARELRELPFSPQLVVCDVSFISVRLVLPPVLALAQPGWEGVVLVKPQFEAGRAEAARGRGVITDAAIWRRVLGEVRAAALSQGAAMIGVMPSPITGAEGNVEFLVHCRVGATESLGDAALDAVVATAEKG